MSAVTLSQSRDSANDTSDTTDLQPISDPSPTVDSALFAAAAAASADAIGAQKTCSGVGGGGGGQFGERFYLLPDQQHTRELRTVIWSQSTSRSDFKFHADRLIRLVVEEGLNLLPYTAASVVTPTGSRYAGLRYQRGNCGVSIVRSGEAMEQGLRDCCRSIRIGKVLVASDSETHEARAVYAKFPADICRRRVLLLYPIMNTGNTVVRAVSVMREHGIADTSVILLTLFCTPAAVTRLVGQFPGLRILSAEVHTITPNHFGQKYFGTD